MQRIVLDNSVQCFLTDGEGNLTKDPNTGAPIPIARDLISGKVFARVSQHPSAEDAAKFEKDPSYVHNATDDGLAGWWKALPDEHPDHVEV